MNQNPAAATAAAKVSASRWHTNRLEDYVYLRCFGLTLSAAAEHLGVARRQAERYESYWKQTDLVWPPREDPPALAAAPVPVCRNAMCACPEPAHPHRDGWRCGYCRRCYTRWMEHGFPASGPPAERTQRVGWSSAGRVEDYAELRTQGLSRAAAALRLGVTIRTALRYESRMRSEGIAA